jgi:hypothetical protein
MRNDTSMDPAMRKRLGELCSPFKPTRTWLLDTPFIGIADVANVVQRFPINRGFYGIETVLMALNGVGAVVAFAALTTNRGWQYTAFIVWVLVATVRLPGVGHLE